MGKVKEFLKRKNIVISGKRYGIDALGAMAQGLFCSLLIGTILNTLGTQLHIDVLVAVGGYASAMSGAAMAVAIGYALQAPPLVLFSLATVGYAANALVEVTNKSPEDSVTYIKGQEEIYLGYLADYID